MDGAKITSIKWGKDTTANGDMEEHSVDDDD
jgi:hypothetical protein